MTTGETDELINFYPVEMVPLAGEALIMAGAAMATRDLVVVVEAADVDRPGIQSDPYGVGRLVVSSVDPDIGVTTRFELRTGQGRDKDRTACSLTTVGDVLGEDITAVQELYLDRRPEGQVRRALRTATYVREVGEAEPAVLKGGSREAGSETILGMLQTVISRAPQRRKPEEAVGLEPAGIPPSDEHFTAGARPVVALIGELLTVAGAGMRDQVRDHAFAAALSVSVGSYGALYGGRGDGSSRQVVELDGSVHVGGMLYLPQAHFSFRADKAGGSLAVTCQLDTVQRDGTYVQQQVVQADDGLRVMLTEGMIGADPDRHEATPLAPDGIVDMARVAVRYATGEAP